MRVIHRNPEAAARESYDILIIGGGVYGVMLLLESSCMGLRTLLLEKGDFGAATSFNSLRLIHGGLRYLQQFDLLRFRESVRERHWFLRTFPALVQPIPCLMPLYNKGLRRTSVLRAALWINDLLSWNRNRAVSPERIIPSGKILDAKQSQKLFSGVDRVNLRGSALWYDACVPDSHRIIIEVLRSACGLGATALNYMEVNDLQKTGNRVEGANAIDHEGGRSYEFTAKTVVNAAGPTCRLLAEKFDRDIPSLFTPSIGWNVLFDRQAVSTHVLAVTPPKTNTYTYFLVPWKGMLLVGTGHASWKDKPQEPRLSRDLLAKFLENINFAIAGLHLEMKDVLRIYIGFLPSTEPGGITNPARPTIIDHSRHGGPEGLYSVSGVKFTTSHAVAEKTLNRIRRPKIGTKRPVVPPSIPTMIGNFEFNWMPAPDDKQWKNTLTRLIEEESVVHLDDLVLRRTNLGDNPHRALKLAPEVCSLFPWDKSRCAKELNRLEQALSIERRLL